MFVMRPRWRHPVALGALALAVLAIGVALAYVAAARVLKSRIAETLCAGRVIVVPELGTLDLDLASTVEGGRLQVPGTLTLHGLQLEPSSRGDFLGVPHGALLALLKDRNDRIELPFRLDGRIDDPRFSVGDEIVARAATSLAARLGGGLDGLARDARGAGRAAIEGATEALRGLFGR
jgi:hypothetical protein